MIVPYHDNSCGVYSTHMVCYTDIATTEAVCVDMMPTTYCAYCGQVPLLQTMCYGQPMVCEPCYWMSKLMDQPVSLSIHSSAHRRITLTAAQIATTVMMREVPLAMTSLSLRRSASIRHVLA